MHGGIHYQYVAMMTRWHTNATIEKQHSIIGFDGVATMLTLVTKTVKYYIRIVSHDVIDDVMSSRKLNTHSSDNSKY